MKNKVDIIKTVLVIIAVIAAVASVVALILTYKDQIAACIANIKEKFSAHKAAFTEDEYADFADV